MRARRATDVLLAVLLAIGLLATPAARPSELVHTGPDVLVPLSAGDHIGTGARLVRQVVAGPSRGSDVTAATGPAAGLLRAAALWWALTSLAGIVLVLAGAAAWYGRAPPRYAAPY